MTDRAEPRVTPLTVTVGAIAAAFHEWAGHTHDEACTCHERAEAFWLILATLDAATPRPGLVEAHCPGCRGWIEPAYLAREDCPGAALASGTGEPGLDVDLLARALRVVTRGSWSTPARRDPERQKRQDEAWLTRTAGAIAREYVALQGADR
jgi:hypothetical protein